MSRGLKTYFLEKIKLDEGELSRVPSGHQSHGTSLSQFSERNLSDRENIESIYDIKVGKQLLLTQGLTRYHRTSKIKEILEKTENYVTFKTKTSTYRIYEKGF